MAIKNEFKEALAKCIEDGELEKVKKYTQENGTPAEIEAAEHDVAMLEGMTSDNINNIPFIPLLMSIHSAELLKDVILYMNMKAGRGIA